MVNVFPDAVWPYAKMVPLKPCTADDDRRLPTVEKISAVDVESSKTLSVP